MHSQPRILLWGARAQARIIQELLRQSDMQPSYIFDAALDAPTFSTPAEFTNRPDRLAEMLVSAEAFVVCIGGDYGIDRAAISNALRDRWMLHPLSVIAQSALIDPEVSLGDGVQIMPGACIRIGTQVAAFTLINTRATVDHECSLGEGCHIMGSAALAGQIQIGPYATIGTNATIIPRVRVGAGAYVGAGSVVIRDVAADSVVAGNPARNLRLRVQQPNMSVLNALSP